MNMNVISPPHPTPPKQKRTKTHVRFSPRRQKLQRLDLHHSQCLPILSLTKKGNLHPDTAERPPRKCFVAIGRHEPDWTGQKKKNVSLSVGKIDELSLSLSRALYVPNWARDWSVLYTQNGWTTASATVATVHIDISWPLANLCIFPTLAKWAVYICWASEVLSVCWKSISFTSVVAPTSGQVGRCVQAPPHRRLPVTQNLSGQREKNSLAAIT